MLLPVIRQDFRLCDEYCFKATKEDDAISCPITGFSGANDPRMPFKNMVGWQDYTKDAFDSYVFSGGHFFIQQHIETITELMMRKLQWH